MSGERAIDEATPDLRVRHLSSNHPGYFINEGTIFWIGFWSIDCSDDTCGLSRGVKALLERNSALK